MIFSGFSMIFNGFSMIFIGFSMIFNGFLWFFNDRRPERRPSTAGASTIDGWSFEIDRFLLIFNDFQWFSMVFQWFSNNRRPERQPARASKPIDFHWFSMIFNGFSLVFQRSTAGASTIDGWSFEIDWFSMIFNGFQWFFNGFSTIDGQSVNWPELRNRSIFIDFQWFSMVFQWFFNDRRPERRPSTAGASTIDGWSFEIDWFSLIFNDFQWFSMVFQWFFNNRRPERQLARASKSIDFHWFSMIFNVFHWDRHSALAINIYTYIYVGGRGGVRVQHPPQHSLWPHIAYMPYAAYRPRNSPGQTPPFFVD